MRNFILHNKIAIIVFLITFSVFSIHSLIQLDFYENFKKIHDIKHSLGLISGEEPHILSITSTVIRHQSVYMEDHFLDENRDPNLIWPEEFYSFNPKLWHAYESETGHYINFQPMGLSYLLVPGYALSGIFGAFTTMSFGASMTSVVIYKFSSKLTNSKLGFATSLIFSFSTIWFIWSNQIYPDPFIGLVLITSLYLIFEKRNNSFYMLICGILVGFGIFLKMIFFVLDLVLIPILFIFLLKKEIPKKNFLLFVFFFIIFSSLAVLNNIYTDNSIQGGGQTGMLFDLFLDDKNKGHFAESVHSPWRIAMPIETFFGHDHGLFIFSPVCLLFVLGLYPLWQKSKSLLITIGLLSALIIIGYDVVMAVGPMTQGDPPFRYLLPILPLLALPFSMGMEKFFRNITYKILLIVSLVIGLGFSIGFTGIHRLVFTGHSPGKSLMVNKIYLGLDFLFPTLGPTTWGSRTLPHSTLNEYNIIFLSSLIILLILGTIYPALTSKIQLTKNSQN